MKGYSYTALKLYRQYYCEYSYLMPSVSSYVMQNPKISQSVIGQLENRNIVQPAITQSEDSLIVPPW